MNKTRGLLFTAAVSLAMAFTLSCEEKSADKPSAAVADTGGTATSTPVPKTAAPAVADKRETFTDSRDGKKYKYVKIGTQTWMAENLNYEAVGGRCYELKNENCEKYGQLYDWETASKACPAGWHLPKDTEWQTLVKFAGGEEVVGKKLKAKSGWDDYDGKSGNGTDEFGFSALPGGQITNDLSSYGVGILGRWWSATKSGRETYYVEGEGPYYRDNWWYYSISIDGGVSRISGGAEDIFSDTYSVRCVKDK